MAQKIAVLSYFTPLPLLVMSLFTTIQKIAKYYESAAISDRIKRGVNFHGYQVKSKTHLCL